MSGQLIGQTCAILTALTWAFAMVFFRLSGRQVTPLALNLFKNTVGLVLLAATLLILWAVGLHGWIGRLSGHSLEEICILLISGFLGIAVADTIFFHALNLIGVSIVAIVDCLYSPSIIFFSFLMLSERLGPFQYVGVALILSAVLVSSRLKPPDKRTHAQLVAGILLGALAMAFMGFGIVLAKPVIENFPLIWATTLRMLAGTLSLAVIALALPQRKAIWSAFRPASVWKWSMPGAFLGAYVSMILWVAGFKYMDASVASILNQTSTIFAIILATLILKERFGKRKLLAVTLAMTGVVLVWLNSHLTSWLLAAPGS
ncbi:MAG: DMT family transporter [Phycisphaerae bacterium]|nr:DMT family transporter [Phycisphaerae bacterium]